MPCQGPACLIWLPRSSGLDAWGLGGPHLANVMEGALRSNCAQPPPHHVPVARRNVLIPPLIEVHEGQEPRVDLRKVRRELVLVSGELRTAHSKTRTGSHIRTLPSMCRLQSDWNGWKRQEQMHDISSVLRHPGKKKHCALSDV